MECRAVKKGNLPSTVSSQTTSSSTESELDSPQRSVGPRRSFLKNLGIAGAALGAGTLFSQADGQTTTTAAASAVAMPAILWFLAAAEIIETDLWLQYQELGAPRTPNFQASWAEIPFTPKPSRFSTGTWSNIFTTTPTMR
jgi:hypothetical protein